MVRLNCYRRAGIVEKQINTAFEYVKKTLNVSLSKALSKEELIVRDSDINAIGELYDSYENVLLFIYTIAIIKSDMAQRKKPFSYYYDKYKLQCTYDTLACINVNYREILRIFEVEKPINNTDCI